MDNEESEDIFEENIHSLNEHFEQFHDSNLLQSDNSNNKEFINENLSLRKLFSKPQQRSCPICSRVISSRSNLRKHINRAHGKPSCYCFICGKSYKATCDLRRHLLSSHNFRLDSQTSVPTSSQNNSQNSTTKSVASVIKNQNFNNENCFGSPVQNNGPSVSFSSLLAEDPSFEQNLPDDEEVYCIDGIK